MQIKLSNYNQVNSNKSNPNFGSCNLNFTKQDLRNLVYDASKETISLDFKTITNNLNKLWLNIKKTENLYKNDGLKHISFNLENDIDDAEHMVIASVGHVRKSFDSATPLAESKEYETFVLSNGDEFRKTINNHTGAFYN